LKYSNRIKPLLKREVNNETSSTSLKSYNQMYYYSLLYAVQLLFFVKDGDATRNFNIGYIHIYICKVGMPPWHPWIFSFDPLDWENYRKAMRWACRKLKTNKEENLTKHVGFVYAYVTKAKNRKIKDDKSSDRHKMQDS